MGKCDNFYVNLFIQVFYGYFSENANQPNHHDLLYRILMRFLFNCANLQVERGYLCVFLRQLSLQSYSFFPWTRPILEFLSVSEVKMDFALIPLITPIILLIEDCFNGCFFLCVCSVSLKGDSDVNAG